MKEQRLTWSFLEDVAADRPRWHYFLVAALCANLREEDKVFSTVEHLTLIGQNLGSNPPFATIVKLGHLRSLHEAPIYSAV